MLGALVAAVMVSVPPGYVDDAACAECHADRAASYQQVAMAKSFFRPQPERLIEDFDAPPFFHGRSGQYFEMRRRGETLLFRRYRLAADGAPIDVFEQQVDWILGSGNHARTYLYQLPGGELYQLPVSWYTESGSWRMAPGYDRPDHDGVTRRVRHECMFCHNAYSGVQDDSLSYWRPQSFPRALPEGIGCQRCHGPGAEHARTRTRTSIVNPIRLPVARRNDLCYSCHMQPTVVLAGIRRFGRSIQSFRPGQALAEYAIAVDIDEEAMPRAERFEINHHPYRLEQSRCFTESEGRLSCLSCHDPHKKISDPAHYRKACLSCHGEAHRIEEDCTSCHMQKRRPQDVVHVVMTDHWIRRTPGGDELLRPLEEREPVITGVEAPDALTRAIALVRATGGAHAAAARALEQLMHAHEPAEIEPWLDLASAQLRQRWWEGLEATTQRILDLDATQELAIEWHAIARAALTGDTAPAIRALRPLERAEAMFNRGVFLAGREQWTEAIGEYGQSLALRPNNAAAWFRLGQARQECGDLHGAIEAFRRTLAIDPAHVAARKAMGEALLLAGEPEEAERYRNVATGRRPPGSG